MANIDNIDRESLREDFSRYVHNEIDKATRRYRMAGQSMNLSGRFSAGNNVLTVDPLVKYRFVGREAIDDLDFSQSIQGNPDRTWSDSSYHTPFFTQGVPYWGIGDMVMKGTGTNLGQEPSNPFLIATYGDDWISTPNGENLSLNEEDIDKKAIKYLAEQRGLTEDKIKTIQGFSDKSKLILSKIQKILQEIEAKDIAHRGKIPDSKKTIQDYLERSVSIPEVDSLLKEHKELTKQIHKFGPEISTHILGDPSKGILPWSEQFAKTSSNPYTKSNARFLESAKTIEDVFPPNIQDFKRPFTERTDWGKGFLARYPEMALSPVWRDYSPDLQKLLKTKNSINSNVVGLDTVLSTTNLTPDEFGLVQNPDGSFSVNPTIKTGLKNKDPLFLDVSSDEDLFKKIKEGRATTAEISRAFGLGALANTGYRTSIGDERLDYMAFPNDNIETMPSVVIPRKTKEEPFKIPASAVQLANRPFAVWEWSNGKFNLINEGNNKSIGGSKPIPTGSIVKQGAYPDFTNARVEDLFKRNSRGGFVAVPKFLDNMAGEMALNMQTSDASNFTRALEEYNSNPQARQFVKSYTGQTANNAVKGLGLAAYAHGLATDAPSTIVAAGLPFTRFTGVGPVLELGGDEERALYNIRAYGNPHGLEPETKPREVNNAYLDYIYGFPSGM